MALEVTRKKIPLRGLSISIEDIRRIVEKLLPYIEEEGHREVALLLKQEPADQEHDEQLDVLRARSFRITVTITGKDGESLFGYGAESFDSPNIPEPIGSIYITNNTAYRTVLGQNPLNNFTLDLDFSTPPLIDNNNPVSSPTPNFSNLTVEGTRGAWVASIQQAVMGVLEKKSNSRSFLHFAFVYDIGLLLLGFPAAIYLCWRLADIIENKLGIFSPFISVAAYIYIFFLVITAYRILFGYTKWAFPIVELTNNENQSKFHRKFWYGIVISIFASAVYDLLSLTRF